MLHMACPMLIQGASGPTYADFQAHIATLATGGSAVWGSHVFVAAASKRTTCAAATGNMYNTVWGDRMFGADANSRAIQHGLPSEAVFNAQVSAGREVFYRVSAAPDLTDAVATTRNGYTSLAYNDGNPYGAVYIEEIIYWDGTQAQRMTPRTSGGPTVYTF